MNIRTDLRRAFARVEPRCGTCRPANGRERRALTLVEVLVVVAIIGMLLALMLPAVRSAREPARRTTCIYNLKQLSLGIQHYQDTRKSFPLASTSPLVTEDGNQKFGAVSATPEAAEMPTDRPAGQQGDGYSWIAQCLPYLEEDSLYEKMTSARD